MALLVTQLTDLQLIDKIAPYLNLADFKNETYGAQGTALHAATQQEREAGVIYQFKGHLPKPYDSATDEIALIPITRGGLWWFIACMKQPFHMTGDCDKLLPFLASHEQDKELIEISRNVSKFSNGSIYCAGPDVFYNDVYQRRMRLTEHLNYLRPFGLGYAGLPDLPEQAEEHLIDAVLMFKLPENTSSTHPKEIYETCLHHIEKSRGVLANLSPFNGIEPDSGTVMEVGYAHAIGRPIYAYTSDMRSTAQKYLDSTDPDKGKYWAENNGSPLNLMLDQSCSCIYGSAEEALAAMCTDIAFNTYRDCGAKSGLPLANIVNLMKMVKLPEFRFAKHHFVNLTEAPDYHRHNFMTI